jgi:propionyl-CoA synthetase
MEEILADHPAVAECAVFGIHDELKGQVPLGLVVLKNGINQTDEALVAELKARVRAEIGGIASLKNVLIVERLPKTRSGKILRKTLRQMIDGEEVVVPSTIENPDVLTELAPILLTVNT